MKLKKNVMKGSLAGMIATGPMTAAMALMRRWLPWWQQGPMPPHKVTSEALAAAGLETVDEDYHQPATWAGHFGYGAAGGALYPLVDKLPLPTLPKSVLYGLGVWAASYMGWLPAAGWLAPAIRRPMRRNLLMMAAHVVWGFVTGLLFKRWQATQNASGTEGAA